MVDGIEPVITFQNVSKRFVFIKEQQRSIWRTVTSAFSRRKDEERHLWAVRDLSFTVLPGQCFGIVGRNGSGKSTALKLIARILRPTDGRIIVRGRVSALLELGAGFHPDLTGRENIYLNASLLGLDEAATNARFADIVTFSELGEYIEMPVKHYSSGMYMRLGFSVAIHMQPDVLIVDEILAVGDQAFQTKCLDAIRQMREDGVTIIMVSHNLNVMRTLCTHMLWLEKGQARAVGAVEDVAAEYQAYAYEQESAVSSTAVPSSTVSRGVDITAVRFLNARGEEAPVFLTGEPMTIEMHYVAHKPVNNPEFGLAIFRQDGVHVNGPNTKMAGLDLGWLQGPGAVRYHIEQLPLLPARYEVTTAVHDGQTHYCYAFHKRAYAFRVVPGGANELDGLIAMPATWAWAADGPTDGLADDREDMLAEEAILADTAVRTELI
jgi:ABC-type polysaccharide/polyol phosphate transport system ATPase subunit